MYICGLKKIKEIVMSVWTGIPTETNESKSQPLPTFNLTRKEIELLLIMIKESTFKGGEVEILYNIVLKLQKHYLEQE